MGTEEAKSSFFCAAHKKFPMLVSWMKIAGKAMHMQYSQAVGLGFQAGMKLGDTVQRVISGFGVPRGIPDEAVRGPNTVRPRF